MDDGSSVAVDSSINDETYSLGSSGIDTFAVQELNDRCTNLNQIPLLKEALSGLNMVLLACGDSNGFLTDNIADALASIEAFCIIAAKQPAEFIIQLCGEDKVFLADQIEVLNMRAAELYAPENNSSN